MNHLGSDSLLAASKYLDWEESFRERRAAGAFLTCDDEDDDFDVKGYLGREEELLARESSKSSGRAREASGRSPDQSFLRSQSMWDRDLVQSSTSSVFTSPASPRKSVAKERRGSGGLSRRKFAHVNTQMREEDRKTLLQELFTLGPKGSNSVHNVVRAVASRPHLCMLVDKAISLVPGSELFTVAVGPRDASWTPFFKEGGVGGAQTRSPVDQDGKVTDNSSLSLSLIINKFTLVWSCAMQNRTLRVTEHPPILQPPLGFPFAYRRPHT